MPVPARQPPARSSPRRGPSFWPASAGSAVAQGEALCVTRLSRSVTSLRVVSLDLDGTLIHPAAFNAAADGLGFGEKLRPTYKAYIEGRISLEEAFRLDIAHFAGLPADRVRSALRKSAAWTPGIREAV